MTARPLVVLALVDLVQDIDVLAPVLDRLNQTPAFSLHVVVSQWLARRAPRIPELLRRSGVPFQYVQRPRLLTGQAPGLDGVDALLTAAESSAGPHRWAHALARRAAKAGVPTFTIQHGLDNLVSLAGPQGASIASDVLFCWTAADRFPEGLEATTLAKLVPVGRALIASQPEAARFDVGLFDNLHAKSYSDDQRRRVLDHIIGLARARPGLRFYVRAHPAGGWLDRAAGALRRLGNVAFVSSEQARRSVEPGSLAVTHAARIITTPSTIALDAAQQGRPVALALDGGAFYSPLPHLADFAAWTAFADAPAVPGAEASVFLARHLLEGDAAARIVEHLAALRGKCRAPEPLSH